MSRDAGFTLPELLIGMVITTIVGGAILAAILLGFRTADAGTNRLVVSHDLQLASTYFESDVQNADIVCRTPNGTSEPCVTGQADATTECVQPGDSTPILQLRWLERDQNPPTTVVVVAYVINGTTIVREQCSGPDFKATDLTLQKSAVVVHQLAGTPPTVTVTCTYVTGASDACTSASPMHPVTKVNVALASTATSALGVTGSGNRGYTDTVSYTLTGETRSTP